MNSRKSLALLILLPLLSNSITYALFAGERQPHSEAASFRTVSIFLSSIEVGDNDTYIIENGHYVLNDSITVRENATLIVRNAILDFNVTSSTVLYSYDNATINISNSTISSAWGYYYVYFYGKTSSIINGSSFVGSSYFRFYDTSTTVISSTRAYSSSAYSNATVTIMDTTIQYFYCYGLSKITILRSVICYLYVEDSSSVFTADSTISDRTTIEFENDSNLSLSLPNGMVDHWNLYGDNVVTKAYVNLTFMNTRVSLWNVYCYGTSIVTIANSSFDTLYAYDNSTVSLHNCTIGYMSVYNYCNVKLIDSTISNRLDVIFASGSNLVLSLQQGYLAYWNLYTNNTIAKAYVNLTLQRSSVTGWNINAYNSTISLANSDVEYFYMYDNCTLSVQNSSVYVLYSYAFSSSTITSASIDWLYPYDSSIIHAEDSNFRGIYANGNSSVSVSHIRTEYLSVSDYASLLVSDSLITYRIQLSFIADSNVSLDSLPNGRIEYWNLYENATVGKAYLNLTIVDTKTRGWGEINVNENSVISVSNSIVGYFYCYGLSQITMIDSFADGAYLYDNSSLSIVDSMIETVQFTFTSDSDISFTSLPSGWVDYWNLYQNSSVRKAYVNCTVSDSWINEWDFTAYDSTSLSFMYCTVDGVYAYDSSKISMNNCTVSSLGGYSKATISLIKTTVRYNVYAYDDSTLTMIDSNIQSRLYVKFKDDSEVSGLSLPTGLVNRWSLSENATVKRSYVNLTISDTSIKGWGFYIYGFSAVSFINSNVEYLAEYDFSTVLMENCTVENLYVNKLSRLLIASFPTGKSVITYLYTYGMSNAAVNESRVAIIYAYQDSAVKLTGSDYAVVRVYDRAKVQISWFLEVHILDQGNRNAPFANVSVTDASTALVYSTMTDGDGWTRFALPEKTIDVFGSHPVGNYSVKGAYSGYTATKILEMTENKQVTINLPFTIPEFSLVALISFLTLLAVCAIALRKRFSKGKSPSCVSIARQ